ncbi:nitrophenyl compound nitroreductase subunit ArsF family protein [Candidatus Omnitrophota bacterium]
MDIRSRLISSFIVSLAIASVLFTSSAFASEVKVIAYYFHGNFRCFTCTAMENYSRQAIETNFEDALASGKLEFKPINTEKGGNEHFVNEYQLYTKSLILSFMKDGKEIRSKNLDKIWELVRNKQKFITYVTEEIQAFLEETK